MGQKVGSLIRAPLFTLRLLSLLHVEDDARHELARNMVEQGPPGREKALPACRITPPRLTA